MSNEYMTLQLKVKKAKVKELSKIGIGACDLLETVIKVCDTELINYIYSKDNIPYKPITEQTI